MTGKDFTGTIWAAEHPADAASHIRYLVQILAERDATIATLERELERLAKELMHKPLPTMTDLTPILQSAFIEPDDPDLLVQP